MLSNKLLHLRQRQGSNYLVSYSYHRPEGGGSLIFHNRLWIPQHCGSFWKKIQKLQILSSFCLIVFYSFSQFSLKKRVSNSWFFINRFCDTCREKVHVMWSYCACTASRNLCHKTYSPDRQWCPESIHTLLIESIHTLLIESIHTLLI